MCTITTLHIYCSMPCDDPLASMVALCSIFELITIIVYGPLLFCIVSERGHHMDLLYYHSTAYQLLITTYQLYAGQHHIFMSAQFSSIS